MAVVLKTETIYECTCDHESCKHSWKSSRIPTRCAACKSYTWNRPSLRYGREGKPIIAFGKTQTIAAWAREYKIGRATIGARLKYGWTTEEAIATPLPVKKENPVSER